MLWHNSSSFFRFANKDSFLTLQEHVRAGGSSKVAGFYSLSDSDGINSGILRLDYCQYHENHNMLYLNRDRLPNNSSSKYIQRLQEHLSCSKETCGQFHCGGRTIQTTKS